MILALSPSIILAVDGFLSETHGGIFLEEKAGKSHTIFLTNNEAMQCSAVQWCKCVRVEVQEKGRGADRPLFGCQGHSGSDCCLKGSFDSWVYWVI